MLTETGRVVALDDGAVWVETLRSSSCQSCAARSGCGHGLVNSAREAASRGLVRATLEPARALELKLHDRVEISLPERGFLRAASLLYLLPLLAMILGAMFADVLSGDRGLAASTADLVAVLGAVAGLGAGLLLLRSLSRGDSANPLYQPRVTGKL